MEAEIKYRKKDRKIRKKVKTLGKNKVKNEQKRIDTFLNGSLCEFFERKYKEKERKRKKKQRMTCS